MRAIDADKVPELFDKEYRETMKLIREGENHLNSLAEGFSEEAKVIREMPTIEPYGTWIPCSQQLPREEGWYQVTCEGSPVWVEPIVRDLYWDLELRQFVDIIRHTENRHKDIEKFFWTRYVTAWMPLPLPYREEKKDE